MDNYDLRWDDIRLFLAVARGGTLSAAANELGVNASTVHRRVTAIETALTAQLFDRAPRGYTLTNVGEALLPQAEDVEESILALRRTATGHDRTATGPVTMTIPETMVSLIAPQLAAVCELCPGLRPVVRSNDRLLDLGVETDIAFRATTEPPESAVGRRLATVAWAIYQFVDAPVDSPWVLYTPEGPTPARAWLAREVQNKRVLLEVSSVGAMHGVLSCTHARGLLPCYLGDSTPGLQRVGDIIEAASAQLWLLIHADLRRSARVRALVDLLVPRLEEVRPMFEGKG